MTSVLGCEPAKELTTALATMHTGNVLITTITLCNKTAGAVTVRVGDKQATPRYVAYDLSIAANASEIINYRDNGQWFAGGLQALASANSSIDMFWTAGKTS